MRNIDCVGRVIARVESVEFIPGEFSSIPPGGNIANRTDKKGRGKSIKKKEGGGGLCEFQSQIGFGLDSQL